MRKVDFDLAQAVQEGFNKEEYEKAVEQLNKYKELFERHRGIITGYWVGLKNKKPCFIVAVERGKCEDSPNLIADKLGEYEVFYLEGHIHL